MLGWVSWAAKVALPADCDYSADWMLEDQKPQPPGSSPTSPSCAASSPSLILTLAMNDVRVLSRHWEFVERWGRSHFRRG
jgi:hypothetical protein